MKDGSDVYKRLIGTVPIIQRTDLFLHHLGTGFDNEFAYLTSPTDADAFLGFFGAFDGLHAADSSLDGNAVDFIVVGADTGSLHTTSGNNVAALDDDVACILVTGTAADTLVQTTPHPS